MFEFPDAALSVCWGNSLEIGAYGMGGRLHNRFQAHHGSPTYQEQPLDGKVALVTVPRSDIGKAVATDVALKGAKIVLGTRGVIVILLDLNSFASSGSQNRLQPNLPSS